MDHRLKELIDFTREKFGLENYYLQTHTLHRKTNVFNETIYTLSMEWFPNHITELEEDLNPDGTAVIEVNIFNRKFESVIFVNGITYATKRLVDNPNKDHIIAWIEQETGFTYGKHFSFKKEVDGELYFQAYIDGIPTSPASLIEIKTSHQGMLLFFSMHGQIPEDYFIEKETYTLTLEEIEPVIKKQLKLIEFPLEQHKQWHPVYAIEEIYIFNKDGRTTIPFGVFSDVRSYTKIEKPFYWQTPMNKSFERQPMNWMTEVSIEQAFSYEQDPNLLPITENEQEKSMLAIEHFLRQVYPNDSGKWSLHSLHRENGYIHGILRQTNQSNRLFQPKLHVIIDTNNFQVVNYLDSAFLLETFQEFEQPLQSKISKADAYQILAPFFTLTPTYVYNMTESKYRLCGKLDCSYGVDAVTGKVVSLNDL